MDPITGDLNDAQRQAVDYGEGPLMIVAGAGSGKTRVITRRVARLLRDGEASESILALTFTNKAAGEMARRVLDLGGRHVHVATFHSACARFLRAHGHHLGYPRDFTIYDTYDRDTCIKMLMEEREMALTPIKPSHVGTEISRCKNLQVSMTEYRERLPDTAGRPTVQSRTAALFDDYNARLRRLGAMDFDDLMLRFLDLLNEFPEVAEKYRERFHWVLVDEFQDTNRVQYDLAKQLSGLHRNLCVVGDPDQSIYRFRGAEIRNILDFERDFPDVQTIRLETNYRSTRNILQAAQGLIIHNAERLDRDLTTDNPEGERLVYRRYPSSYDENDAVGGAILELVQARVSPAEIAVFYRSHYLSRGIEEVLRRHGVPYEVVGGLSFFERREIKDLLAYLRVLVNPLDDVSMARIINVPTRKIGNVTLAKLRAVAAREQVSLFELVMEPTLHEVAPKQARRGLASLAAIFEAVRRDIEIGVEEAVRTVVERTQYVEYACKLGDPQDVSREENIGELIADAADFDKRFGGGLSAYLAHVSLLTSEDRRTSVGPTVSLMSVHAAKGLEFDHVFVIGLEDGLFPSSRAEEEGDIEEERRLMYVALTRGRETVHLSGSERRMVQGYERDQVGSRFLEELPPENLDREDSRRNAWHTFDPDPDYCEPQEEVLLAPDTRVAHAVYGEGVVVRVSGVGMQARAVVRFDDGNERQLMLEYANLQIVPQREEW